MSRPVVRNEANTDWIDVFCKGGWKMKTLEGDYIALTARNTRFRNADNTGWINFSCPIPPPTTIMKANVRSNRLVDSSGFLWAAGNAVGKFDNGSVVSSTWRKCRYDSAVGGAINEYIQGVKSISSGVAYDARTFGGGGVDPRYPSTTLFMHDNRILFSGLSSTGLSGHGSYSADTEYNNGLRNTIRDATNGWATALGEGAKIIQHDRLGALVLDDGTAFTLGYATYYFAEDTVRRYVRKVGYSPRRQNGFSDGVGHVEGRITCHSTWERIEKFDTQRVPLSGIVQAIRTSDGYTFMLTEEGRILQTVFWSQTNGTDRSLLIMPSLEKYGMQELGTPFTHGKIVALHQGGVAESENGDLFVFTSPTRLNPSDPKDFFMGFSFVPLGVNTKSFGDRVKVSRIALEWKAAGNHSLFIQLDDGRLYASGDNASGWFGIGAVVKTDLTSVTLLNRNVYDFDIDCGGCILVKNDGTIWASGNNSGGRLGIGHTRSIKEWEQGVLSND